MNVKLYNAEMGDSLSGSLGGDPTGRSQSITLENPWAPSTGGGDGGFKGSAPTTPSPAIGNGDPDPATLTLDNGQKPAATPPTTQPAATPPPAATPQPPSQAPQPLTAEQIAEIAANAASRVRPPQAEVQPAQPPQMSREEFNQTFGVVNPTTAEFSAMFGVEPNEAQLAAFTAYGQRLVRQAILMTDARYTQHLREQLSRYDAQLQPIAATHRANAEEQHLSAFMKANPDLNGYDALVRDVASRLDPKQFAGIQDPAQRAQAAYNAVATRARALLNRVGQSPQQTSPQGQTQQPQQSQRQMAPTSVGGRAGGGEATTPANDAKAIWG